LTNPHTQADWEMDFKSPINRTKNKFDEMDLDELGQEVVLCDQSGSG